MTPKFISSAFTVISLILVFVAVSGCVPACGVGGQRCTTTWTYTQQSPNQWVVTQTQGY
jgi:hypothetical protein